MRHRKDGVVTREKILLSARQVFCSKGYFKATHAEICRAAGVNSALINFYFGSKDELYRAVWQLMSDDVERRYPLSDGQGKESEAAVRLATLIRALLHRALDPQLADFQHLRMMEMINPSGLLAEKMHTRLQQHRELTLTLLRELLGSAVTAKALELCEMSIINQIMMLNPHRVGKQCHRYKYDDVENIARHITTFSLAGIAAVRQQYAANERREL